MRTVVVLGADGMLGHKLFQRLRERFPGTMGVIRRVPSRPPLDRVSLLQGRDVISGVNAMDFQALRAHLESLVPSVIVNCIGVIKARSTAVDPIPSLTINALFPHRLAAAAAAWGGRVIHFSTDCVFNGRRGHYTEEDALDADDLYGRTKFLGEVTAPNAVTLRTSIIGRELMHHQSLLDWFLAQDGTTVKGYRRAIYSGITTNEMAHVVARVIEGHPHLSGLFQVVSTPITKYDLLHLLRDAYDLKIAIEPDDRVLCDRSMRGERFEQATGWRAPAWPELVGNLASDPTPYAEWLSPGAEVNGRRPTGHVR